MAEKETKVNPVFGLDNLLVCLLFSNWFYFLFCRHWNVVAYKLSKNFRSIALIEIIFPSKFLLRSITEKLLICLNWEHRPRFLKVSSPLRNKSNSLQYWVKHIYKAISRIPKYEVNDSIELAKGHKIRKCSFGRLHENTK